MTWAKGQSGNKQGRPATGRMLAKALRTMGELDDHGHLSNKMLLARMIWEALAWGHIRFANGEMVKLSAREWLDLMKWVHLHVDGPYQPEEEPEKPVLGSRPDNPPLNPIVVNRVNEAEPAPETEVPVNEPVSHGENEAWGYGHVYHEEVVQQEDDPEYVRKAEAYIMRLVNEA